MAALGECVVLERSWRLCPFSALAICLSGRQGKFCLTYTSWSISLLLVRVRRCDLSFPMCQWSVCQACVPLGLQGQRCGPFLSSCMWGTCWAVCQCLRSLARRVFPSLNVFPYSYFLLGVCVFITGPTKSDLYVVSQLSLFFSYFQQRPNHFRTSTDHEGKTYISLCYALCTSPLLPDTTPHSTVKPLLLQRLLGACSALQELPPWYSSLWSLVMDCFLRIFCFQNRLRCCQDEQTQF